MQSKNIFDYAKQALADEKPFVLYRKSTASTTPEFKIQGIFQHNNQLYTAKNYKESGFVMAPFDLNAQESPLLPMEKSEIVFESIPKDFLEKNPTPLLKDAQLEEDKKHHLALVQNGIDAIEAGQFKKAVLSRSFNTSSKKSPTEIYKNLLNTYPNAFAYWWYHPKVGMWMGATPETLLRVEGNKLHTMALAGTKPVEPGKDAQWTPKEIEEQQLVTDFIKETLYGTVNNLKIGKVNTIRAGKLWHLMCELTADIEAKEDLKEVLEALHPTPAVGGMPKETTKKFILHEENYDRKFYTGFIGELNIPNSSKDIKQSSLFVNLRCMQLLKDSFKIYVGGGIVHGSNPESEWQETVNKSQTMLDIL